MFGIFGPRKLKLDSHAICDCGLARTENQDCIRVDAGKGVFCVADGMGGGDAGGLASRMVCDAVGGVEGDSFDARVQSMDVAILAADSQIRAHAAENRYAQMGSTVAALLIDRRLPARGAVVHVGDSRVYLRRGVRLACLTRDHRNTAYSHLLTQVVGSGSPIEPDWQEVSVLPGDVWIVCSDGVHEMLPDSTLNALVARAGSAAQIAGRISDCVRKAGARDNYSIIVVRT